MSGRPLYAGADQSAGLYLHVPFCSFVCPYCDFAVTGLRPDNDGPKQRYLAALRTEIDYYAQTEWRNQEFGTLYLGGGTPSILEPDELASIVEHLKSNLQFRDSCKIFMEANPEDISPQALAAWKKIGVTFLSLGLQSFQADELQYLGRRHHADEALKAVEMAQECEFETLSVDLIFGFENQSFVNWRQNIERVAELGLKHFSSYQLTVKPGTLFAKRQALGRFQEISEDEQADFLAKTHSLLDSLGFEAYEVSNFRARGSAPSAHNIKYWQHSPYLGLGPSAHSFGNNSRFWNHRHLDAYAESLSQGKAALEGQEKLGAMDLAGEELMLRLRTMWGVDFEAMCEERNLRLPQTIGDLGETFVDKGLLTPQSSRSRFLPTSGGMAVADSMAGQLYRLLGNEND